MGPRRRAAGLLVGMATWSAGVLLANLLPWTLLAAAVAVTIAAAAAHAFTVGLYLRLLRSITTSFGVGRTAERLAATLVLGFIGATYWQAAAADGPLRQLVVGAVYLLGLAVYHARGDLRRAIVMRIARVHT